MTGETTAGEIYTVDLASTEGGADLSKDVVLYYRLDEEVPARLDLVPYRSGPQSDGTFMLVVTPGADLQPITGGQDWTFVLDISGSMGGGKIATLADGVAKALKRLNPADRFRIVTFNDEAREFSGGYRNADPANVEQMITAVKGHYGRSRNGPSCRFGNGLPRPGRRPHHRHPYW